MEKTSSRRINQAGLDLIKSFEGFSPTVYLCPAGRPTVGHGHVVKPGELPTEPISEAEAEDLLAEDLRTAEAAVDRLVEVPLTDGQFAALVSFVYNLGSGAFAKSTLRRKLNAGDYAAAAGEFSRWVKAGGREMPGLVRRRAAEVELFLG